MTTQERYIITRLKRSMARTRRILACCPIFYTFLHTEDDKEILGRIKDSCREYLEQLEDVCIAIQASDIPEPMLEPVPDELINLQFLSKEVDILFKNQYDVAISLGISPDLLSIIKSGVESHHSNIQDQNEIKLLALLERLTHIHMPEMDTNTTLRF